MASSARTQASNQMYLIPKFRESDIVAYPDWEHWVAQLGHAPIYKIDSFEQYGGIGIYRCRMWSFKEKKWVDALPGEMVGYDGKAMFEWNSPLERNMEAIEPLGLLVKYGIG